VSAAWAFLLAAIVAAVVVQTTAAAPSAPRPRATGPNECPNLHVSGHAIYQGILRPAERHTYRLSSRCGQTATVKVSPATTILDGSGARISIAQLGTARRVEVSGAINAGTMRAVTIQFI
jgi:hypothetical protein